MQKRNGELKIGEIGDYCCDGQDLRINDENEGLVFLIDCSNFVLCLFFFYLGILVNQVCEEGRQFVGCLMIYNKYMGMLLKVNLLFIGYMICKYLF